MLVLAAAVKADVAIVGFGAIKASAELTSIIQRIVLSKAEDVIFLKVYI
jgi:hypothetical protein